MIKIICDTCGKVMEEHGEETINVDFNSYGIAEAKLYKLIGSKKDYEYNLCIGCAAKVHDLLADMKNKSMEERRMIEGGQWADNPTTP